MSNFKLLFLCSKVIRLTLLCFKVRWLIPCLLMYCRIHVTCCDHRKKYSIFAWPCIIDINNIDNQLGATIAVY